MKKELAKQEQEFQAVCGLLPSLSSHNIFRQAELKEAQSKPSVSAPSWEDFEAHTLHCFIVLLYVDLPFRSS